MAVTSAAGVDNTVRKKWDRAEYAAKALERQQQQQQEKDKNEEKHSLKASDFGLVVKQPLNKGNIIQRDFKKDLEAKVGTVTLVNPHTGEGSGFVCKETGVVLKDSLSYLDHINSKKTQRDRGLSVHAERSTVEQVRARFTKHKKRKEAIKRGEKTEDFEETDLVKRIENAKAKEEEELEAKRERRRLKKEAKKRKGGEDVEKTLEDEKMMKAMGFSGFSSK